VRLPIFSVIASGTIVSAWLFSLPVLAAPAGATVNFTPPVADAKTIQVTMTEWRIKGHQVNPRQPPPLQQASTTTYLIERPAKFRVEMKNTTFYGPVPLVIDYNSDGTTMVTYQRGKDGAWLTSEPAVRPPGVGWPNLVSLVMDSMQEKVSAIPAVRDGKQVLLVVSKSPNGRDESWYDPKTHLLMRMTGLMMWKGKATEINRIEFTGWVLDAPLPPATFVVPPSWTNHK